MQVTTLGGVVFDKETYRARFPDVAGLLKLKTQHDTNPNFQRVASEIAVATGVPVVVCFQYIGEILGYTDQLRKYIKDINAFYGVTCEDNTADTIVDGTVLSAETEDKRNNSEDKDET